MGLHDRAETAMARGPPQFMEVTSGAIETVPGGDVRSPHCPSLPVSTGGGVDVEVGGGSVLPRWAVEPFPPVNLSSKSVLFASSSPSRGRFCTASATPMSERSSHSHPHPPVMP